MSLQADYLIPTDFGLSEERKMMIDMLKKFKEKVTCNSHYQIVFL